MLTSRDCRRIGGRVPRLRASEPLETNGRLRESPRYSACRARSSLLSTTSSSIPCTEISPGSKWQTPRHLDSILDYQNYTSAEPESPPDGCPIIGRAPTTLCP